jgi:isoleucyl-tRNA synthetase
VAALDPVLTDELRSEGIARELVNRIQRLRKDAGYSYTTRIAVWLDGPQPVLAAARAHAAFIQGETLAREFHAGGAPASSKPDRRESADLDGHAVMIAVTRHPAGI